MTGVFAVTDFRNSQPWNEARFVVCELLEFTEAWSRHLKYRRLAKDVERLSVSLLDNLTRGYEQKGNPLYRRKAERSLHELGTTVQTMLRQGGLTASESERLKEQLQSVRQSLMNFNL